MRSILRRNGAARVGWRVAFGFRIDRAAEFCVCIGRARGFCRRSSGGRFAAKLWRWRRIGWCFGSCVICLVEFFKIDFSFELVTKLPRHGARLAYPSTHLLHEPRQSLGPQHNQRDAKNDYQFKKADFEQGPKVRPSDRC
jgi:hypothetical protein